MFSRSIYLYNTVSHIVAQFAAFWCIQLPIPSAVSTIQYNLKRQNEHFSKVALSSRVIFHQQQYWRTPYLNSFIILPNWIYPCQIRHLLCLLCTFFCFSWTEPNVLMNFSNYMLLFRLSEFPVPATQIWRASDRSVELESGFWTKLTRSMTILLETSVISDLFWWKK